MILEQHFLWLLRDSMMIDTENHDLQAFHVEMLWMGHQILTRNHNILQHVLFIPYEAYKGI
jgi:hypothetical protein